MLMVISEFQTNEWHLIAFVKSFKMMPYTTNFSEGSTVDTACVKSTYCLV